MREARILFEADVSQEARLSLQCVHCKRKRIRSWDYTSLMPDNSYSLLQGRIRFDATSIFRDARLCGNLMRSFGYFHSVHFAFTLVPAKD